MRWTYRSIVEAICYSVIREHCPPAPDDLFPHNAVASFVLEQQQRMPDYLRPPMMLLTVFFDLFGLIRCGRRFHRQSHEQRVRQLRMFSTAPLGVMRDFVRFYTALSVFRYHDFLCEHDARVVSR